MPVDTRLTYDDFCLLPDDGKRHEIINGEHYVAPSPLTAHQKVVGNLHYYLADFLKKTKLGEIYVAPFDVVFSFFDVVEPDLLYISRARASVLTEKNIQGAPDLVIEVLSKATEERDRTTKLKLYSRFGVREYWIVNPVIPSAEIYRQGKEGLEPAANCAHADSLTSPQFPGFSLPVPKLLE